MAKRSRISLYRDVDTVLCLLKAGTVEPEKQPLLCNGCATCNNGVTVGSSAFCLDQAEVM
jgi:hypothetical protein